VSTSDLDDRARVEAAVDPGVLEFSVRASNPEASRRQATAYAGAFRTAVLSYEQKTARTSAAQITRQIQDVERRLARAKGSLATGLSASLQALQTQAAEQAVAPSDTARVIQDATAGDKVSPQPLRNALITLLLAPAIAAAVLALVLRRRDRFASPAEVSRELDISTFAEIPVAEGDPEARREVFRTIRERLLVASREASADRCHIVLVTSPEVGSGKSFTASNLALSLATADRATLLIDADLRRPSLQQEFNLASNPGLGTWLRALDDPAGPAAQELPLQGVDVPRASHPLYVLTAGDAGDDAPDVLGSDGMERLLMGARQRFEFVVLDSSPVGEIADTLVLARHADSTLFVVDARRTRRTDARRALQTLRAVNARVLGVVMNRSKRKVDTYRAYRAHAPLVRDAAE
jgi:capsular exopolysaccharide synthesis family protein